MLIKDPSKRITAKQALAHNWFTLEHTSNSRWSVYENVRRYQGESIFNVSRIKPQFSYASTCTLKCDKPLFIMNPLAGFNFGRNKKTSVSSSK
jgi:serine/threonine protein kinase